MTDAIRLSLVVVVCVVIAAQLLWEAGSIVAGFDRLMLTSLIKQYAALRAFVAVELVVFPIGIGAHLIYEATK